GRGIGRDLVKALAKGGATVIALTKTQANLDSLKAECPSIETVCADVGNWDETREAVKSVLPIHALVNNAAIAEVAPFLQTTPESFDRQFNINVKSILNVSQVVAQDMIDRKAGGVIVQVSSQASQAALKDHVVYAGTKGALDIMAKIMALELGEHNIRVNCVNPTVVMTDMGRVAWSDPVKGGQMLARIPLGRFAEVEEVVNAILFLLSDQSSMINGVILPIDGGFLAA
ncbi:unnamed protein product, partial [Allacma fusca]